MRDFLSEEKQLCAEIEELCVTDPDSAHALIDGVIADCGEAKADRAPSAAVSRICRRGCRHRTGGEPGAASPAEKVVITAFLSTIGTKHRESVLKG